MVLEREGVAGGKARTIRLGKFCMEAGPTGFMAPDGTLDEIARSSLSTECRLQAREASARRYLVLEDALREVRPSPVALVRSGILSPLGLLRMASETVRRRKLDEADESIHAFARRRLGSQVADRMIAPMVQGVYAGDAKRLSLAAAFPKLAALERDHGSLIRGMLAKRKEKSAGGPAGPGGTLTSFKDGLQSLPLALAEKGGFEVRTNADARELHRLEDGRWRVVLQSGEVIDATAVVLAGECWSMAPLVRGVSPAMASELAGIDCPPVAVVAMGYGGDALSKVPQGFGALIPRGEGYRMLGVLWDTHIFEGRSPDGKLLLRCMYGGSLDPEAGRMSEQELADLAREELGRLHGLPPHTELEHVVRWPRAIPQYELGHLERVRRIEKELEQLPGLFLAGNALHGVAFGKAAEAGARAGKAAAQYVQEWNERGSSARG